MDRRAFTSTLATGLFASPFAIGAEESGKVWRVGFAEAGAPDANQRFFDAFRLGLRELGYVERQNLVLVDRWAGGQLDRFPALLTELVRLKVDVIVVASGPGALAAKAAVTAIPVVFVGVQDPVGNGLVASLRRPGANLTGFSLADEDGLASKRLEILKEAVPTIGTLAFMWNPTVPGFERRLKEAQVAARTLGMTLRPFEVRQPRDIDETFSLMRKEHMSGLMVLADPLTVRSRQRIVDFAASERLPAIYPFLEFVQAGGLIAYGPSVRELFHRAAIYVDKIFKGTQPSELPVEQPTKFELLINLRTADALGLTIPQALLLRADEVIR
jgi:putative ABC transport system substrate-binding protein